MNYRAVVIVLLSSLLIFSASGQTQPPAQPRPEPLPWPAILGEAQEKMPEFGRFENFTIVGYSHLDGWDKPTEIRVSADGKWAFTAHNPPPTETQKMGGSIVDVSDPTRPRVVARAPSHPNSHSQYIDVIGNTLVLNQEQLRGVAPPPRTWEPGIRLFDISEPTRPREVGFFRTDNPPGPGVHGMWLHEDPKLGGLAYLATSKQGYMGNILLIVDINSPAQAKEIARWWYPGTHTAGGEKPGENWIGTGGLFQGLPRLWTYLHDITVYKDRAYLAYRDQGVIILDVSDATRPKMISQVKWSPPEQGNTHSIGVVVPKHGGRPDLLVVADEIFQCPYGYMHIIDVRYERNPVQIATFRLPVNRHCPPGTPQSDPRGIHDMDRMIRGDIAFSSWEASGFWAVDISDPYRPRAAGYFIPPPFVRANSNDSNADDVFVHSNGLIYATSSEPGGGLWILRYTPGVKGTVTWTPDKKGVTVKYD